MHRIHLELKSFLCLLRKWLQVLLYAETEKLCPSQPNIINAAATKTPILGSSTCLQQLHSLCYKLRLIDSHTLCTAITDRRNEDILMSVTHVVSGL